MEGTIKEFIDTRRGQLRQYLQILMSYPTLKDVPFRGISRQTKNAWADVVMSNIGYLSNSYCADQVAEKLEGLKIPGVAGASIQTTVDWILSKYDGIDKESNCFCFLAVTAKQFLNSNGIAINNQLLESMREVYPETKLFTTREMIELLNYYSPVIIQHLLRQDYGEDKNT